MTEPAALIAELRALIAVARTAELADAGDLGPLADRLREVRQALEPHVVDEIPMQAGLYTSERKAKPGQLPLLYGATPEELFAFSPVIGPLNAVAPEIRLWVDGNRVHGEGTFGPQHCGPPGGVHGGHVAALLDEVLGLTCLTNETGGFTGTLSVRYESLTPISEPLKMRGWIEGTEGRKTIARGEVLSGDTRCATAEGIFITARPDTDV